jgi:hypothetical protein
MKTRRRAPSVTGMEDKAILPESYCIDDFLDADNSMSEAKRDE